DQLPADPRNGPAGAGPSFPAPGRAGAEDRFHLQRRRDGDRHRRRPGPHPRHQDRPLRGAGGRRGDAGGPGARRRVRGADPRAGAVRQRDAPRVRRAVAPVPLPGRL
ncbi:MAG: Nucleoid-associated protein YaaK, partial [uncultured Gemmatimonadetes bacterium]